MKAFAILVASLLAFCGVAVSHEEEQGTLQMAMIILRHGDRNPIFTYKNDPYMNHTWPGGHMALTQKGVRQMYALGNNLKAKYQQLLPADRMYSRLDMKVLSSKAEHTMMSAQTFMAGFAEPGQSSLSINWQPIPVHSIPWHKDRMLANSRRCPKYIHHLRNLLADPPADYQQMVEKIIPNENLYEYLSNHTGVNVSNFISVLFLMDTLKTQADQGLELPEWTQVLTITEKLETLYTRTLQMLTENMEMKRLRAGVLLNDIVMKMFLKKKNVMYPNRKLFVYSGHGLTLSGLFRALHIEEQTAKLPEYASALAIELHRSLVLENDLEIKMVYYPNSETEAPVHVSIPGCYEPCALKEFLTVVKPYLIRNFDRNCRLPRKFLKQQRLH